MHTNGIEMQTQAIPGEPPYKELLTVHTLYRLLTIQLAPPITMLKYRVFVEMSLVLLLL